MLHLYKPSWFIKILNSFICAIFFFYPILFSEVGKTGVINTVLKVSKIKLKKVIWFARGHVINYKVAGLALRG